MCSRILARGRGFKREQSIVATLLLFKNILDFILWHGKDF